MAIQQANVQKTGWLDFKLPIIGNLPIATQLQYLTIATVTALLLTVAITFLNILEGRQQAEYVLQATDIELAAERLGGAAAQATSGDSKVFDKLVAARKLLGDAAEALDKGKPGLPATVGSARPALDSTLLEVNKTLLETTKVEAGRAALSTLGRSSQAIELADSEFTKLHEELVFTASPQLVANFELAREKIARVVSGLLSGNTTGDQSAQLGGLLVVAQNALLAMPAGAAPVVRASELFESYQSSVSVLAEQTKNLVDAKGGLSGISSSADAITALVQPLREAYQANKFGAVIGWIALGFGLLSALLLLMIFKVYLDTSKVEAVRANAVNTKNQNAILLLMNELSDLADGDLTAKATVSEEITGAIADSVNYTASELRTLVTGVKVSAQKMGVATARADLISKNLLLAAQKQSKEIINAEESVQLMAKSIQEVDSSATKATKVGNQTLAASEQGALAVRNAITGMDGIREQIQETSKRIKRLGESSQEIGEIVELISDITEQTNVLALNAAIQAASAGEAGRGFSVVAEEVQRLAERSAEATKQIGALVKTIQSDTYDAVAAMEKSTVGVVDGAKLADAAGQSLSEIQSVSKELASLINSISVTTQVQTDMVGEVSSVMKDILSITGQTTEATRQTTQSVAEMTSLASALTTSVAGFKVE
jgi:twitching motility protein PilJ